MQISLDMLSPNGIFFGLCPKFLSAIALEFWISHNPEYLLIKRNLVSKFAIEVKVIH